MLETPKSPTEPRPEGERIKPGEKAQMSPNSKLTSSPQTLITKSHNYFHNLLSEFVFLRTYARWIEKENRRETWIETVDRYMDFMKENLGNKLSTKKYNEIREAILNQEVMPSMRLLQFAGEAARSSHVSAYNCAYIAPSSLEDLGEIMYIAMCGTGVGFSVETQNIQKFPTIKIQKNKPPKAVVIKDSREGWCDALVLGLKMWFAGSDITFDYSKLRPAGARLKTFGGRSSGPEPLKHLMNFCRQKILNKQGGKLSTLEVYDIICKIGEVVMLGGVRRAAMISLSDLDDVMMRSAKIGQFYYSEPQRIVTNNSAVYLEKPAPEIFLKEWLALMESGTGERGIFNRGNLSKTLPERRIAYFKKKKIIVKNKLTGLIGINPCGEIILQSKQFCNLSEIVARPNDTETSLLRKIRIASLLGTYQATLTKFHYLSKEWQKNCEEERLLGVSITGHWDCPALRKNKVFEKLKKEAIRTNIQYASSFGITPATAVTCVKPSGNVSQLVDSASGMHPRHSEYYIRRVRISALDPLLNMLKSQKIPFLPEVGQSEIDAGIYVVEFPVQAPRGAVLKSDLTALQQLDYWKRVKKEYTEHNPSVTISIEDNEWIAVANWLYDNWECVGGLSFLPRSRHTYELPPYEAITRRQYNDLLRQWKKINFDQLIHFELTDQSDPQQEFACFGPGSCDV